MPPADPRGDTICIFQDYMQTRALIHRETLTSLAKAVRLVNNSLETIVQNKDDQCLWFQNS